MDKEITNFNNTWDVVPPPKGKRPIGCERVYKIKRKVDGSLDRYKAVLVAKGFTQKYGIDFQETPMVKLPTIRSILALATSKRLDLYQPDVNNAFFHGDLHEEVYI